MYSTSFAGDKSGGLHDQCISRDARLSVKIACPLRDSSFSTLLRYLVIHKMWHLTSETACAVLRYSSISLFCSTVARSDRLEGGGRRAFGANHQSPT